MLLPVCLSLCAKLRLIAAADPCWQIPIWNCLLQICDWFCISYDKQGKPQNKSSGTSPIELISWLLYKMSCPLVVGVQSEHCPVWSEPVPLLCPWSKKTNWQTWLNCEGVLQIFAKDHTWSESVAIHLHKEASFVFDTSSFLIQIEFK